MGSEAGLLLLASLGSDRYFFAVFFGRAAPLLLREVFCGILASGTGFETTPFVTAWLVKDFCLAPLALNRCCFLLGFLEVEVVAGRRESVCGFVKRKYGFETG